MSLYKRFEKKLGELDPSWRGVVLTSQIPENIRGVLNTYSIKLEDYLIFNISSEIDEWFGIGINGLLIFQNNKLEFVSYEKVEEVKINYNLDAKTVREFKGDADTLDVKLASRHFILKSESNGAVFTIKRLLDFGMTIAGSAIS